MSNLRNFLAANQPRTAIFDGYDVAYRMLGSAGEAEDAVQETWLRLSRSDTSSVANLGGWLTTVTARVCLSISSWMRSATSP